MAWALSLTDIRNQVATYFNGPWSYKAMAKTAYSGVMAALAWKQHVSPQYATSILSFQRGAVLGDVIALGSDCHEFYQEIQKTAATEPKKQEWYRSPSFLLLIGLAFTVINAVAVSKINYQFRPIIDLSSIVKAVVKEEEVSGWKFDWYVPQIQVFSQWIYLNRIVLNLGLALVSSHKISHLVSALFQAFSLFNILHLHWVDVEIPFEEKVKDFQGRESTLFGRASLSFFIPPANQGPIEGNLTLHNHLQLCVQSIYHYIKHVFQSRVWVQSTRFGDKSLELMLPSIHLESCICGLSPFLTDVRASGTHSIYGSVPIEVINDREILRS